MKITDQELETLQEQEKKKNAIAHDLGALESRKHKLLHLLDDVIEHQEMTFESIEESLLHLLDDVIEHQEMTFESIEESYGKININLETGEYEEIKEDNKDQ
jgi:hypothetical protein